GTSRPKSRENSSGTPPSFQDQAQTLKAHRLKAVGLDRVMETKPSTKERTFLLGRNRGYF
ncbi:MAG: hypothetical protein ACYCSN_11710, partial [Acidobacteriaceae bacterium]